MEILLQGPNFSPISRHWSSNQHDDIESHVVMYSLQDRCDESQKACNTSVSPISFENVNAKDTHICCSIGSMEGSAFSAFWYSHLLDLAIIFALDFHVSFSSCESSTNIAQVTPICIPVSGVPVTPSTTFSCHISSVLAPTTLVCSIIHS